MELELTAVFRRVPEGYIAFVEELPGANTQGATLDRGRASPSCSHKKRPGSTRQTVCSWGCPGVAPLRLRSETSPGHSA